ncbi:MAG: phosphoglycerate dehydrogenase [Bdellovibrionales bacterium]|nr:phosphoglycerate dehydrogenase [Bdellovibrionales bacterium]
MSIKILLLENIHPCAQEALAEQGFQIHVEKGALGEDQLAAKLADYQVLGIRSKTQITAKILERNPHLHAIGAFCIGTNQIDLIEANRQGIPVFNAPYSNTRSVAELVLAEMVALSRQLGDVNNAAHRGEWLKSAKGAREVRGKTLGIVGYGHIGSQVSILAEALGLRVLYYDIVKKLPLGNARSTDSLNDLLTQSDFVTLHVPETPLTRNMMGASELQIMRRSACLINASRGTVVEIPALAAAVKSGHIGGAACDVFPEEPENNDQRFHSELQGLKNVILTPHIGGSTEEAQEAIGREVAHSLGEFLLSGLTLGAVNFPQVSVPPKDKNTSRLINVHRNVPGVLGEINGIVSKAGGNIRAQYLSTDIHMGYVVMDTEGDKPGQIFDQVSRLKTSIKTRIV